MILVNDGVISGSGRIDTGLFHNRHLGEVRVGKGDELLITSTSNLEDVTIPISPEEMRYVPLVNYGLIEVHDGEIELMRGEDDTTSSDTPTYQSFKNLRLSNSETTQVPSRGFGLIEAQNANLRFQTGVDNQGLINFIGGTSQVYGDMTNEAGTVDIDEGLVSIVGDDTFVVFNGDLTKFRKSSCGGQRTGIHRKQFHQQWYAEPRPGKKRIRQRIQHCFVLGRCRLAEWHPRGNPQPIWCKFDHATGGRRILDYEGQRRTLRQFYRVGPPLPRYRKQFYSNR